MNKLYPLIGQRPKILIGSVQLIRKEGLESEKIHFAVMAIEAGAREMGISPMEMRRRLEKMNLIKRLLLDNYEVMHTQSLKHVGEDVAEALKNWEAQEGGKV